jgi:two-component system, OmpR family, sensor histidine kinase BaeS
VGILNRLEVRLVLLMMLVAAVTSLMVYWLNDYQRQQAFRELPSEVRDLLQRDEGRLPPLRFPTELRQMLTSGYSVVLRLEPSSIPGEPPVFFSRPLSASNSTQEVRIAPLIRTRGPSFEERLQQNLLIAGLVSTLLGGLLAILLVRPSVRPIEAVSRATQRMSEGDLSVRVPKLQGQDDTSARLAQNFNHMAESLEQLETQRKAMIADVAHELRTPLTVMQGRLEAIQDGVVALEPSEIDRLHSQTLMLSRLVEDLRTLSLADAGKLTLERRKLDARSIVQQVVESFSAQAEGKGVRLEVRLPEKGIELEADPIRLSQVLGNLIANALNHTPGGGRIEVQLGIQNGKVLLQVLDSGSGIPEEALPRLFDRFYRAEESRSRKTGGSGLGLAIVKALVELHGGKVEAKNRSQGGAVFEVRLPFA